MFEITNLFEPKGIVILYLSSPVMERLGTAQCSHSYIKQSVYGGEEVTTRLLLG